MTLDEVESKFADDTAIIQAIQYIRERDKSTDSEKDEISEQNEAIEIENDEELEIENKEIEQD